MPISQALAQYHRSCVVVLYHSEPKPMTLATKHTRALPIQHRQVPSRYDGREASSETSYHTSPRGREHGHHHTSV